MLKPDCMKTFVVLLLLLIGGCNQSEDVDDQKSNGRIRVVGEITGYSISGYRVKYEEGFDVADIMVIQILHPEIYRESSLTLYVPLAKTLGADTVNLKRKCEFAIESERMKSAIEGNSQLWFEAISNFELVDEESSGAG